MIVWDRGQPFFQTDNFVRYFNPVQVYRRSVNKRILAEVDITQLEQLWATTNTFKSDLTKEKAPLASPLEAYSFQKRKKLSFMMIAQVPLPHCSWMGTIFTRVSNMILITMM
jgi:hypothetical protein